MISTHTQLLVTLSDVDSSEEARDKVYAELITDTSFVGEGGRFGCPIADWFVIGGRWSGALSAATWAKDLYRTTAPLEEQPGLMQQLESMYQQTMPTAYRKAGLTYDRDSYQDHGYADDAMLVTPELYDALLKSYEGQELGYHREIETLAFIDLDDEPLSADIIGRKWLVVVDYHW